MCIYVCINKGEVQLQTPREYNNFFKEEILDEPNEQLKDCCLCGWEEAIEEHLMEEGIEFEVIGGDIYIDNYKTN